MPGPISLPKPFNGRSKQDARGRQAQGSQGERGGRGCNTLLEQPPHRECLLALQAEAEPHWKGCAGHMTVESDVDSVSRQMQRWGWEARPPGEEGLPSVPAKRRHAKPEATQWQNFTSQEKLKPHHF